MFAGANAELLERDCHAVECAIADPELFAQLDRETGANNNPAQLVDLFPKWTRLPQVGHIRAVE